MQKARIGSLDGARALSIILVIIGHLALVDGIPYSQEILSVDIANFGVRTFFVISGFLITTLLLQEYAANGFVSLRDFYVRRLFRIFPAFYVFLAVTTVIGFLGITRIDVAHLPAVAAHVANYADVKWIWDHTWSLAVEEQFYLIWPIVLAFCGWRFGTKALFFVLFVAPIYRVVMGDDYWSGNIARSFEANADALATGCVLAVCREQVIRFKPYALLVNSWILVPFALVTLLITRLTIHDTVVWELLKVSTYNLLIMMILDRYMRHPSTFVGQVLNWKPITFIGTISYSLYLWQQLAMFNTWKLSGFEQVAFSFVAALISYYIVEKPFLRLRKRFERPRPHVTTAAPAQALPGITN